MSKTIHGENFGKRCKGRGISNKGIYLGNDMVLLDKANSGHSCASKLGNTIEKDKKHPWNSRLWNSSFEPLIVEKPEKMIKVDGKEFSEATLKLALKQYVGD